MVFINDKKAENLWLYFVNCCEPINTGFQEAIRLYQESIFASAQFRKNTEKVGIHLQSGGSEAYSAIGQGERYHQPLRSIFNIVNDTDSEIYDNTKLRIAIKGINYTMGPEGLVPLLLVLGVLPSLPAPSSSSEP